MKEFTNVTIPVTSSAIQVNLLVPSWISWPEAWFERFPDISGHHFHPKRVVSFKERAERGWKSGARSLSWKSGWKPSMIREFWHQRISGSFFRFRDIAIWKCIVGRFKSTIVTYCLCWMLDLRHVSVGQTSLYWHSVPDLLINFFRVCTAMISACSARFLIVQIQIWLTIRSVHK